jgi:hypothetical protein
MTLPVTIPNQFANETTPVELVKLDENFTALGNAVNEINGGLFPLQGSQLTINANTANSAVLITQNGTGNALLIEDTFSPDASPFVIDASGNVGIGASSPGTKLDVRGQFTSRIEGSGILQTAIDSVNLINWQVGSDGTAIYAGTQTNHALRFVTNNVERARITGTGNVGIGLSNPGYPFTIQANSSTGALRLVGRAADDISTLEFGNSTQLSTNAIIQSGPGYLAFGVPGTERLRIDSIGNVGIGTSSPVNKLQVNGSFGRGAPVTKTGNFTLADTENWIICNGTATITVTLPAASSWTGREVMMKNTAAFTVISNASNVVPLVGGAAGTAIMPATAGSAVTLVSDGTNWIIMR